MSIFISNNPEVGLFMFSIFKFNFLEVGKSWFPFSDNPKHNQFWELRKKCSRIVFYSILVIEKHVYFNFQKLSSRIIHVFDVLFNFPGGWKSRNISFWLPEEGQFWRLKKYLGVISFYSMIDYHCRRTYGCLFSITSKCNYSCFWYFIQLSRALENQELS